MERRRTSARVWTVVCLLAAPPIARGIDCNRNSMLDGVDIDVGTSPDCNQNGIPDECEFTSPDWTVRESVELPAGPRHLLAADFDGDSLPDLLVGTMQADRRSTVSIYRSSERIDGANVSPFGPPLTSPAGSNLTHLAATDLDGDQRLDVISANFSSVLILANQGDGTFAETESFPSPAGTRFVSLADLNGDGRDDLIAVHRDDDTISLRRQRGDGTFRTPEVLDVQGQPTAVVPTDLDDDGDLDLAVVSKRAETVTAFRNAGDGSLRQAGNHDVGGTAPFAIVAVDLDSDAAPEVAIACKETVSVLTGVGQGVRAPPVLYDIQATSLISLDANRDGDLDLAYGSVFSNAVGFLVNTGQERLGSASALHLDTRWRAQSLATADFDGDGELDIVAAGSRPNALTILSKGEPPTTETIPFEVLSYRDAHSPHFATMGDFNGDELLDVATTGGHARMFSVFLSRGVPLADRKGYDPFSMARVRGRLFSITRGDLDHDGDLDLVIGDTELNLFRVFTNAGDGSFLHATNHASTAVPAFVTLADLDGDGLVDLVSVNEGQTLSVLFNSGGTSFAAQGPATPVGTGPAALAVGDVDGDGDLDIATANALSRDVSLLTNDGSGALQRLKDLPVLGRPAHVALADVSGDGTLDLLVAGSPRTEVLFNTAGGTFADSSPAELPIRATWTSLADLNRDGILDLISGTSGETVAVSIGRGEGRFSDPVRYSSGSRPLIVLAGDIDADGEADFVSANRGGAGLDLFLNGRRSAVDHSGEADCPDSPWFQRGNLHADHTVNLLDPVSLLTYLFRRGPEPSCLESADTDDNGVLEIADALLLLHYLFVGGAAPAPPFPRCGPDATIDGLGCKSFAACLPR